MSEFTGSVAKRCVTLILKSKGPRNGGADQDETAVYLAAHQAQAGRKVVRLAWPTEMRTAWKRSVESVRLILEREAMPWGGEGCYIVAQARLLTLHAKLEDAVGQADLVADGLADRFDELVAKAQQEHGSLFRRDDYPVDAATFRRQFSISVKMLPVASDDNIFLSMANEEAEILREDLRSEAENARKALLERIAEPLSHALSTLRDPGKVFRDSLVENVKAIAELAPFLNITNDRSVEEIAQGAEAVGRVEPDRLREDQFVRKNVADQCEELLRKIKASR